MALYFPPKQGFKGSRPEHWPGGFIPVNLAMAIKTAKNNKEAIFDSNSEWLIVDDAGLLPSRINMPIQPESQLKRADYYGLKPAIINITKASGTYTEPSYLPRQSWITRNWMWVAPVGVGLVLLLLADKNG